MRRVFRYAVCLSMAFFLLMGMASAQERWTVDELMGQAPPTALFAILTNPPAGQYEYIVPTHDFDWEGGGGDRLLVVCLQEDVRLELRRYLEEWQLEKVADYALQPGESVLIRLNIPEGMPGGQIYAERGLHSNIHEIVYDGVGGAGFMSFGIPLGAPEGTLPVQAGEFGDEMQVYENERYGYRLSLPRGMKMKKNVLADGDGGIFAGGNIEIQVWGENTQQDNLRGNCQALYGMAKKRLAGENIHVDELQANGFILSWERGGRYFYKRTWVGAGSANTLLLKFPADEHNDLFICILESFVPGNLDIKH